MAELRQEQGKGNKPSSKRTPLRQAISRLNTAARSKEPLRQFLRDFHVETDSAQTIPTMTKQAMRILYEQIELSSQDTVGFGNYASLSYLDLKETDPGYLDWVLETYISSDQAEYRLARLARWIIHQRPRKATEWKPKPPPSRSRRPRTS